MAENDQESIGHANKPKGANPYLLLAINLVSLWVVIARWSYSNAHGRLLDILHLSIVIGLSGGILATRARVATKIILVCVVFSLLIALIILSKAKT
jgi:hypothetical protein